MLESNIKNRRRPRPFAPYMFLLLQVTAVSIIIYIIAYISYFDQRVLVGTTIIGLMYCTKFFNRTIYILNRCKPYDNMRKMDKQTFIKNF